MFSTGGKVNPESASEGKTPCHLAVIVLFFPSWLQYQWCERRERQLPVNNKSHFETSAVLGVCIASVVIWHSVKKGIKTKQSLWAKCQNPYSRSVPCLLMKNVREWAERERKMLSIFSSSISWVLCSECFFESQELQTSNFLVRILGDLKISIKRTWQRLRIALWQHRPSEADWLCVVYMQGNCWAARVSWEHSSSGGGGCGFFKVKGPAVHDPLNCRHVDYLSVYTGKNPSGPKPLNLSLFYLDSHLCKPKWIGRGNELCRQVS